MNASQVEALMRLATAGESGLPAGASSTGDEISSRTASSLISRGFAARDRRGPHVRYVITSRGRGELARLDARALHLQSKR